MSDAKKTPNVSTTFMEQQVFPLLISIGSALGEEKPNIEQILRKTQELIKYCTDKINELQLIQRSSQISNTTPTEASEDEQKDIHMLLPKLKAIAADLGAIIETGNDLEDKKRLLVGYLKVMGGGLKLKDSQLAPIFKQLHGISNLLRQIKLEPTEDNCNLLLNHLSQLRQLLTNSRTEKDELTQIKLSTSVMLLLNIEAMLAQAVKSHDQHMMSCIFNCMSYNNQLDVNSDHSFQEVIFRLWDINNRCSIVMENSCKRTDTPAKNM